MNRSEDLVEVVACLSEYRIDNVFLLYFSRAEQYRSPKEAKSVQGLTASSVQVNRN